MTRADELDGLDGATWEDLLDALEADARRLAAAAGDPVAVELLVQDGVGALPPTAGQLGQLPRHLAGRARAVLARLDAAQAALVAGRDAVRSAMEHGARAHGQPGARFIDRVM